MELAVLRENFKTYLTNRYPNNNNISPIVSQAFFLSRYKELFGFSFEEVLASGVIPASFKPTLIKYFEKRGRKDPQGHAGVHEGALKLLLEFLSDSQGLTLPQIKVRNLAKEYDVLPEVGQLLVHIGKERFADKSHHPWVHLTGNDEFDTILNDLENTPHAFVLACLMDKQIKAERAWTIPCIVMAEFGTCVYQLDAISESEYIDFFTKHSLHRFVTEQAKVFKDGVGRIVRCYDGDVSRIWRNKPSSARVVYEFLQFRGAGIKIATMAANILARQFQIEFADYYSIDVSPDIHIRRVMWRTGLIEDMNDIDAVIYRARELNPEFPSIIDFSVWEIGRKFCTATNPKCDECFVNAKCPKNQK